MNPLRARASALKRSIDQHANRFLAALDDERVSLYQTVFYWHIVAAGLYLLLAASAPPQSIAETLDAASYRGWLVMNIVGPLSTIVGKRLLSQAAHKQPNEANSAVGGAWMQVTGDFLVFSAIGIYVACVFDTSEWGRGLYGAFFVALMALPSAAMYTWRSIRRVRQMRHRAQSLMP